jgi:hypothetical protein
MSERCDRSVWVRDTYRYTGRTKSGFEMHYREQRCARKAVVDGMCRQHWKMNQRGVNVPKCGW